MLDIRSIEAPGGVRSYDKFVGSQLKSPCICAAQTALFCAGLTCAKIRTIQYWVMSDTLNKVYSGLTQFFFNPYLGETFGHDCVLSSESPMIFEPTPERAILESMCFSDYVNKDIMIEAINNYNDFTALAELAGKYRVSDELLCAWQECIQQVDISSIKYANGNKGWWDDIL